MPMEVHPCGKCGEYMTYITGGGYMCSSCGETYEEDDLPDPDSGLVQGKCPYGCGLSEFQRDGDYLVCALCSQRFRADWFADDAWQRLESWSRGGLLSDPPRKAIFGICILCEAPAVFTPSGNEDEYVCSNCTYIDTKEELIAEEITEKPFWGDDEYVGCYNCGIPEAEANPSKASLICESCETALLKVRNVQRQCPECESGPSKSVHLGVWDFEHHFFCLACHRAFEVKLATCECGNGHCEISSDSTFGYHHYCQVCDREFTVFEAEAPGVSVQEDDGTDWWVVQRPLEEALECKYLVVTEI